MKALIENIQHYCLHDGPGMRTTVFFKGCPLRCLWCSNPTTQRMPKELLQKADDCLGCGLCARVCPKGAVAFEPGKAPVIDRELCDDCGLCARECPGRALVMAGTEYTVEEVFDILKGDMLFYRNSGGGVTFPAGKSCRSPRSPWSWRNAVGGSASTRRWKRRGSRPTNVCGPLPT